MAFIKSEYLFGVNETEVIVTLLESIIQELNRMQNVEFNKIFGKDKNHYFASVVDLRDKKTYNVFSDKAKEKKGLNNSYVETTPSGGGSSVDLTGVENRLAKLEASGGANAYFVRKV